MGEKHREKKEKKSSKSSKGSSKTKSRRTKGEVPKRYWWKRINLNPKERLSSCTAGLKCSDKISDLLLCQKGYASVAFYAVFALFVIAFVYALWKIVSAHSSRSSQARRPGAGSSKVTPTTSSPTFEPVFPGWSAEDEEELKRFFPSTGSSRPTDDSKKSTLNHASPTAHVPSAHIPTAHVPTVKTRTGTVRITSQATSPAAPPTHPPMFPTVTNAYLPTARYSRNSAFADELMNPLFKENSRGTIDEYLNAILGEDADASLPGGPMLPPRPWPGQIPEGPMLPPRPWPGQMPNVGEDPWSSPMNGPTSYVTRRRERITTQKPTEPIQNRANYFTQAIPKPTATSRSSSTTSWLNNDFPTRPRNGLVGEDTFEDVEPTEHVGSTTKPHTFSQNKNDPTTNHDKKSEDLNQEKRNRNKSKTEKEGDEDDYHKEEIQNVPKNVTQGYDDDVGDDSYMFREGNQDNEEHDRKHEDFPKDEEDFRKAEEDFPKDEGNSRKPEDDFPKDKGDYRKDEDFPNLEEESESGNDEEDFLEDQSESESGYEDELAEENEDEMNDVPHTKHKKHKNKEYIQEYDADDEWRGSHDGEDFEDKQDVDDTSHHGNHHHHHKNKKEETKTPSHDGGRVNSLRHQKKQSKKHQKLKIEEDEEDSGATSKRHKIERVPTQKHEEKESHQEHSHHQHNNDEKNHDDQEHHIHHTKKEEHHDKKEDHSNHQHHQPTHHHHPTHHPTHHNHKHHEEHHKHVDHQGKHHHHHKVEGARKEEKEERTKHHHHKTSQHTTHTQKHKTHHSQKHTTHHSQKHITKPSKRTKHRKKHQSSHHKSHHHDSNRNKHATNTHRTSFPVLRNTKHVMDYKHYARYKTKHSIDEEIRGKWHNSMKKVKTCRKVKTFGATGRVALARSRYRSRTHIYTLLVCNVVTVRDKRKTHEYHKQFRIAQLCRKQYFRTNGVVRIELVKHEKKRPVYRVDVCKESDRVTFEPRTYHGMLNRIKENEERAKKLSEARKAHRSDIPTSRSKGHKARIKHSRHEHSKGKKKHKKNSQRKRKLSKKSREKHHAHKGKKSKQGHRKSHHTSASRKSHKPTLRIGQKDSGDFTSDDVFFGKLLKVLSIANENNGKGNVTSPLSNLKNALEKMKKAKEAKKKKASHSKKHKVSKKSKKHKMNVADFTSPEYVKKLLAKILPSVVSSVETDIQSQNSDKTAQHTTSTTKKATTAAPPTTTTTSITPTTPTTSTTTAPTTVHTTTAPTTTTTNPTTSTSTAKPKDSNLESELKDILPLLLAKAQLAKRANKQTTPKPTTRPTTKPTTPSKSSEIKDLLAKLGIKGVDINSIVKPDKPVRQAKSVALTTTARVTTSERKEDPIMASLESNLESFKPPPLPAPLPPPPPPPLPPPAPPVRQPQAPAHVSVPRPNPNVDISMGRVNPSMYSSDPYAKEILCFGDSLTNGYNHHGKSFHPYSIVLSKLLNANSRVRYNLVTSGKTGEMTHADMTKRIPQVLGNFTHFDWVVILAGTNDVAHVKNFGDDDSFMSQLISVWSPKIFQDIARLHQIAYQYGAKTVLVTIPESAYEAWPQFKTLWIMRKKINQALRQFASQSQGRTVLCDLAIKIPRHSLSPQMQTTIWDDHLHFTPYGYNKMAEVVYQCMKPYL